MVQSKDMPIPVTQSISFQLAKKGFIAAILMALILGIAQSIWGYFLQKQINNNTIQEILNAVRDSATQSIVNNDKNFARMMLGSLIKKDFILEATIYSKAHAVFVSVKNYSSVDAPYRFITKLISDEYFQNSIPLIYEQSLRVGTLELTVDHHQLLSPLYQRAILSILLSTILILIICIIMFAVFQRNVTNQLEVIIQSFRSINPRMIDNAQLKPLPGHEKDELGLLITIANEFIRANAHHMAERIAAEKQLRMLNEDLEYRVKERTDRLYKKIVQYEKAEKQLRMYERIVSSTTDMIGLIDQNHQYILVNESYETAFGKDPSELIGKNIEELFGTEMKDQLEPKLERCFNGETIAFEIWYTYPKTGNRYMSVHYSPWIQDDIIEHVVVSGRDITRLKRAEEQLQLARAEAEEANNAKSEFLARMSHEIRTPLNAVIGLTHLAMQTNLTNKQYDYLNKIGISSQSLLTVINDILDFSKIEAGKLTIEHVNFQLDEVLEKLSSILSIKAHEKGLELIFEIAPEVPNKLVGDPLRLGQILTNLTNNAIKFTEQGEVIIRVQSRKIDDCKAMLTFSVIDSGIGMNAKQITRLFKSFSQADTYITRKYGGSGLGLSICKGLIEIMGGTITVSSAPGKGSTFSFNCPFDWKDSDTPSEMKSKDNSKIHILLVDDNKASRIIFKKTLISFSFRVTEAGSGQEALDILSSDRDHPFSLVLVDWKMPEMDGIELTKKIKTLLDGNTIPSILMVTAYKDHNVFNNARSAGIETVLGKPVKPSDLLDSIMSSLNKTQVKKIIEHKIAPQRYKDKYQLTGKILLVEDNKINQEVAQELLQLSGFQVYIAGNGKQALDLYVNQTEKYDAILMDIQMPVLDGYAATKRIRQHESEQSRLPVPIIAMTAHAMTGEKSRCLSAGMNDYTTKPIDPDILIQTLCRWIPHLKNNFLPKTQSAVQTLLTTTYPGLNIANGLARVSNQEDTYLSILKSFVHDFSDCATQIRQEYENQFYDQVKRLVHTLKGVSGNIGAGYIFNTCCDIEILLKNQEYHSVEKHLQSLELNLTDTINAIQSIVQSEKEKKIFKPHTIDHPMITHEEITHLLNEFDQLLQQHNLDAELILKKLKAFFNNTDLLKELSIISDHMVRYDYFNAHNHFIQIKKRIQENINDTRSRKKENTDR